MPFYFVKTRDKENHYDVVNKIVFEMPDDLDWTELLIRFKAFLRGCGYTIPIDEDE